MSEVVRVGGRLVVTGGEALREIEFVSKLRRPVSPAQKSSLAGVVTKVQELVRAAGLGWGVSGKV